MSGFKGIFQRLNADGSLRGESASLKSTEKEKPEDEQVVAESPVSSDLKEIATSDDPGLNPGTLSFEDDAAGGMGRHLGVFSCTLLVVGRIIGTGIFSVPSSILSSVNSVGASLMLWVFGLVLSFCGLLVWLELGTMFPRSGGEKVYLEAVYRRPKLLATIFYATQAIVFSFTASGCIVFAQNILISAEVEASEWTTRGIALGVIVFTTLIHGLTPRAGIWVMNIVSMLKVFILVFVIITGWVILSGHTRIQNSHANFDNAFAGSSQSASDYATATLKVLSAYSGWFNVNYVMNEVKDPVRTLQIAGPLGLGICAVLYMFANITYFAAATAEEIKNNGDTVASLVLGKVFNVQAQRALTVFVALSSLGRLHKRVSIKITARSVPELAKEGMPLPFGNKFWASNWPTRKAPMPGLIMHLIPTVIVILGPPPAVAYPFILDLETYPTEVINLLVVLGLFYLRWKYPKAIRPYKVWWPIAAFFLVAAIFLIVAPFLRPPGGIGDTPPLPYYLYCVVSLAIMVGGIIYWAIWWVVLPRTFGYELLSTKDSLSDGTVVTVFKSRKLQ